MENEGSNIFLLILFGSLLTLLMAGFIVTMVLIHRSRQIKNKQKLESLKAEFEKTILNVEKEIQEETLQHVGRELHDNIGQLLSLTKLTLNSNKEDKVHEGKLLIIQVIKEVRTLSKALNLDWVETVDLETFIRKELRKLEHLEFCTVEFQKTGELQNFENSRKLVLIRVIQECLNNAIKHAQPKLIRVDLKFIAEHLEVLITDNGVGFDTTKESNGSGMHNLKSRMKTIGGTIEIDSTLGKGTQIKLLLPN